MRIVQTVTVFVLIVAAASVASAQRGPIPTPLIREGVTEKISEHVHVIPDNSAPLIPNVAIVVGNRATLVVDTGLGARNGEIILRESPRSARTASSTWRQRTFTRSTISEHTPSRPIRK